MYLLEEKKNTLGIIENPPCWDSQRTCSAKDGGVDQDQLYCPMQQEPLTFGMSLSGLYLGGVAST